MWLAGCELGETCHGILNIRLPGSYLREFGLKSEVYFVLLYSDILVGSVSYSTRVRFVQCFLFSNAFCSVMHLKV